MQIIYMLRKQSDDQLQKQHELFALNNIQTGYSER